jgi:hypothetical protein
MEIVNGYVCQSCCDADLASKNIDPAHPHDGPFGQDRARNETAVARRADEAAHGPAVVLDGALVASATTDAPGWRPVAAPGATLDLSA